MPEQDKAIVVAREWMNKAENDLKTAAHTSNLALVVPPIPSASMPSNVWRNT